MKSPDIPVERLVKLFKQFNSTAQHTLLEYAEFLQSREENMAIPSSNIVTEPVTIPRPDQESVVAAIKRLSNTYPMLDSDKLFHETAHFMTQHIMQGRVAVEVIDELEQLFLDSYNAHKQL